MAVLKKNQVNQILFTMVDSTDFATIEDSLTTFTVKRYGVNHGSAAADISTLSRAPSKVQSGIYRLSLEANACNFDYVALRIAATGAAPQILVYEMRTYDDTDLHSVVTVGNDISSDAHSAATKATSQLLVNQSSLSDIYSMLTAVQDIASDAHSAAAKANSQITVVASTLSDIDSALTSQFSDYQSRVPKEVANASQLLLVKSLASDAHSAAAQANSRALVIESTLSDIDSALTSQFSDYQSRVPKEVANASQLLLHKSTLSDVYSLLSSRVTKEVANASQLLLVKSVVSDTHSMATKASSQLTVAASTLSDIDSAITVVEDIASDAHSAAAKANSQLLVNQSSLSDILSAATEARKIVRNKMNINSATGAVHLYDDDDSIMLSGAVTADGDSTLRTRLA